MDFNKEFSENELMQEREPGQRKWLWYLLIFLLVVLFALWGIGAWQKHLVEKRRGASPFFQVTNREFSLFLWQNPRFMRKNAPNKLGYLPHFISDNDIHVSPIYADVYVVAPQHVLFRYHVWNRLLGKSLAPNPIPAPEFRMFLKQNEEWLPRYWLKAPPKYSALVQSLDKRGEENLWPLSEKELPFIVRFAFQGWKNYSLEWKVIRELRPTGTEMKAFVQEHSNYGRSYWRNVVMKSYPDYLIDLGSRRLREDEMAPFLQAGYYNYQMMAKPSS